MLTTWADQPHTTLLLGGSMTRKSLNRFTLLDGMRGIAALAVVVGHASHEISGVTFNPNMHLAVPFFFMLSGFVLLHAYNTKLNTINEISIFAIHRTIRLLPMLFLAGIIGSAFLFLRFYFLDLKTITPLHIILSSLLSFITIPTPFLDIDKWRWPANPPEWSLFCEFVASALLAIALVRIKQSVLFLISLAGYLLSIYRNRL